MRFLFVSNFVENYNSGAAGSLLEIGKALRHKNHDIQFIWRDPKPPRVKNQAIFEAWELPHRQLEQVRQDLKKNHYNVISISQPFGYLILEKLKPHYPATVFLNRTHGWEDRVYACRDRWQSPNSSWVKASLSNFRRHATRKACYRTLKNSDGVVAPSQKCRQFILDHYDFNASNIETIAHGVSQKYLETPSKSKIDPMKIRLLFVGNYLPIKGSQVLERILPKLASQCPNAHFTFVIPQESVKTIESIYKSDWKNRLQILPWMPHLELSQVYLESDILIFPSLFEGFGRTFLEAMACGLCVVGFDEGGLSDIAKQDESAIFHEPGNLTELEKSLCFLLRHPEKIKAIGDEAKKAASQYSWDRSASKLIEFSERLIKRKLSLV